MIHLSEISSTVKLTETESRMLTARGSGERKSSCYCLMG